MIALCGRTQKINVKLPLARVSLLSCICGAFVGTVNQINLILSGALPAAAVFPITNGGVVVLSALVGRAVFRERLSPFALSGILLGIVSIVTPEYRERFVKLWIRFEERYHSLGNEIMFELMNEITDSKSDKWITLYKDTIAAIRALNPTRLIMVGSAQWNSVDKVCDLEVLDDPNVVYTFHFYTPFEFTHQRGVLQNMQHYYNREMPYPSDVEPYRDFGRTVWGSANAYEGYDRIDKRLLYDCLAPAKAFIEAHPDAILTCGEFGTIRHIKNEHRENWFRDVIAFCDENEIPITIWNYLSTPYDGNRFSLVDDDFRKSVSEKIIDMIRIK